jgi:hypothetical protein
VKRWLAPADAVLQQLAWWGAVLLAARGWQGLAALPGAALVAGHLLARPPERRRVALTAVAAAAYGFVTDTLLLRTGLVSFGGGPVSPAFMVGLWAAFGVGLTASLARLAAWPSWRLAALAALAGPLAYRSGAALGAMAFGPGEALALAAVAIQWAVGLPALALVARRLVGAASAPAMPACGSVRWAR